MKVVHTDYRKIAVTKRDQKNYEEYLRSWRTAHAFVKSLDDTPGNVEVIAEMISCELRNPELPRLHLVNRLHMTLTQMRKRVEMAEMKRGSRSVFRP
jgi:hypothetical protein